MEETVYSVSEAVKILDMKSHVLRYWEEEMKLPIQRNEKGHRYYTRYDVQIFLSIKELKKKGYSLKEIRKLIPLFYQNKSEIKHDVQEKNNIPDAFMEVISRIVLERLKEENSEEARYKRFDERIRNFQQTRREVAAAEEKKKNKRSLRRKK